MRMSNQAITKAIEAMGGMTALAKAIGRPTCEVWQWKSGRRPIPAVRCSDVERVTAGAVTRQELRPDDYWRIWPDLPAPEGAKEVGHA